MISTIEDSENPQEKLDKELLTICSLSSNPTQAICLEQLIAKGADVNVKIKNDDNLLISLIKNGKIHFAQTLIKNGAELVKDEDGRTPLMHASKNGHAEIVTQLLERDSAIDEADLKCQTALMFASQGGFNDVVGILIKRGAEVNYEDENYKNKMKIAFDWFLGKNHLHQIIYNPKTGGCYDGLEQNHVNLNQGAESTISYLLSRLAMENAVKPITVAPLFEESFQNE